jgi:hypothetical protein
MHYLLLAACLAAIVGCTEPGPVNRVQVLSPGRPMRIACHFEMRKDGASVEKERHSVWPDTATQPHIVIKRIETPWNETERGDVEVSIRVASMPGADNMQATMTVQQLRIGIAREKQGEKKVEHAFEFKQGPTTAPAASQKDESDIMLNMFHEAEFIAVVDPNGRIVSADARGEYWTGMKKEFAKYVEKGSSQVRYDWARQLQLVPGVFSSLADAMAYLPPQGVEPGQSWQVLRERVAPYSLSWGFCMLMFGGSMREESTCTLKAVQIGLRGKIAVVEVRGKRFLQIPRETILDHVKSIELTGELEVNLTTGAVEKLRLESTPILTSPPDEPETIKFVEAMSLKPA